MQAENELPRKSKKYIIHKGKIIGYSKCLQIVQEAITVPFNKAEVIGDLDQSCLDSILRMKYILMN